MGHDSFPVPAARKRKQAVYGLFPINLTRMMLHMRGLTLPYWRYALGFRGSKNRVLVRERVIVRFGALTDREYQLVQHKSEALRTGTSQKLLAELLSKFALLH